MLSGVLGALLAAEAASVSALERASLAVYAHGLAGDFAAKKVSQTALTALSILDQLPSAFLQLETIGRKEKKS